MSAVDKVLLPNIDRLRQPNGVSKSNHVKDSAKPESKAFGDFLAEQLDEPSLKFSNHATKRLEARGIDLSSDDIMKIQDAVKRAQAKGAKESLILSDKGAFVVSVKNNTVITAVDKGSMRENIFTNIDSTIMI